MPRRSILAAIAVAAVAAIAAAATLTIGTSAHAAPPLVVFHGPTRPATEVTAARDAVARVAADAGSAFIDLTAAPAAAPTAATQIARAIESYDDVRVDEALAALDAALAEVRITGAAGVSPTELSDLFLYRGLALLQKNDAPRAWDELVHAVVVDPTRVLDPARFPPKSLQAVQRAVAQVRALPTGRLGIDPSSPTTPTPASTPTPTTTPATPTTPTPTPTTPTPTPTAMPSTANSCIPTIDARPATLPPELPFGEHFVRLDCPGERPQGATVILATARQTVEMPRATPATPDDVALLALGLARDRGAAHLLFVAVTVSPSGPPTAHLRLRELPSGTTTAEATVALPTGGDGVATTRAAAERLVARAGGPFAAATPIPPLRPTETRWYERPWLWGIVGAGVTAAIFIPLAVDRGSTQTLNVSAGPAWRP